VSNKRKLRGTGPPMPPHVRAVADQADAADAQLHDVMDMYRQDNPGGVERDHTGRITYKIILPLKDRLAAHTLRICPHLSPDSPAPVVWHPWAPEAVVCSLCALAAGLAIAGTDEDRRCDGCGTVTHTLRPFMTVIPAGVAEGAQGTLHRPSIMVTGGMCRACFAADAEPFEQPPGPRDPRLAGGSWVLHRDVPPWSGGDARTVDAPRGR
jgi:hypothetical protein